MPAMKLPAKPAPAISHQPSADRTALASVGNRSCQMLVSPMPARPDSMCAASAISTPLVMAIAKTVMRED
jgi:hypothetical protein